MHFISAMASIPLRSCALSTAYSYWPSFCPVFLSARRCCCAARHWILRHPSSTSSNKRPDLRAGNKREEGVPTTGVTPGPVSPVHGGQRFHGKLGLYPVRDTFLGSAAGCATANTTYYAQENAVEFPRIQENRRAWPSQVTLIVTFKKFSTP